MQNDPTITNYLLPVPGDGLSWLHPTQHLSCSATAVLFKAYCAWANGARAAGHPLVLLLEMPVDVPPSSLISILRSTGFGTVLLPHEGNGVGRSGGALPKRTTHGASFLPMVAYDSIAFALALAGGGYPPGLLPELRPDELGFIDVDVDEDPGLSVAAEEGDKIPPNVAGTRRGGRSPGPAEDYVQAVHGVDEWLRRNAAVIEAGNTPASQRREEHMAWRILSWRDRCPRAAMLTVVGAGHAHRLQELLAKAARGEWAPSAAARSRPPVPYGPPKLIRLTVAQALANGYFGPEGHVPWLVFDSVRQALAGKGVEWDKLDAFDTRFTEALLVRTAAAGVRVGARGWDAFRRMLQETCAVRGAFLPSMWRTVQLGASSVSSSFARVVEDVAVDDGGSAEDAGFLVPEEAGAGGASSPHGARFRPMNGDPGHVLVELSDGSVYRVRAHQGDATGTTLLPSGCRVGTGRGHGRGSGGFSLGEPSDTRHFPPHLAALMRLVDRANAVALGKDAREKAVSRPFSRGRAGRIAVRATVNARHWHDPRVWVRRHHHDTATDTPAGRDEPALWPTVVAFDPSIAPEHAYSQAEIAPNRDGSARALTGVYVFKRPYTRHIPTPAGTITQHRIALWLSLMRIPALGRNDGNISAAMARYPHKQCVRTFPWGVRDLADWGGRWVHLMIAAGIRHAGSGVVSVLADDPDTLLTGKLRELADAEGVRLVPIRREAVVAEPVWDALSMNDFTIPAKDAYSDYISPVLEAVLAGLQADTSS